MHSDCYSQRLQPSLEYPVLPSLPEDLEQERFSKYYFRQSMDYRAGYKLVGYWCRISKAIL